jgi:magnesium transporter
MSDTDPRPESGDAEAQDLYGVTAGQVATLRDALDRHDLEAVDALIVGLHTADLADLIEALLPAERRLLIEISGPRLDPELLTFLDESVRAEIVGYLGAADVAAAVTELETDDAVDVVASLDEPVQAEVLDRMDEGDRAVLEEALALPEDSAGRLMQREFVSVPASWTVGDTIDFLREEADPGDYRPGRSGEHVPSIRPGFGPCGGPGWAYRRRDYL